MIAALRVLAGVLVGLIVSFLVVVGVEIFSSVVHPFPENFGHTMEEVCRHVERYPQWVLAVAVVLWAIGALVGTWVAQKIGNGYSAAIVGLLLLVAVIFNISKLPYPIWFKVVSVVLIPAAAIAGSRLAMSRAAVVPKGPAERDL